MGKKEKKFKKYRKVQKKDTKWKKKEIQSILIKETAIWCLEKNWYYSWSPKGVSDDSK